jgi:hypothetical protein
MGQKAPFGAYLQVILLQFEKYFFGASMAHSKHILLLVQNKKKLKKIPK